MSEDILENQAAKSVRGIGAPVVLLTVAVSGLLIAQGYNEAAGRMPRLVCSVLIALGLIDLYSRLPLPGRSLINDFFGSGFEHREMRDVPGVARELCIIGWMLLAFVALAVFGLMLALPVFCLAYVLVEARRPFIEAVLVGAIIFVFQFVVFEVLLDYELYRGLLFTKGGIATW